MIKTNGWIMVFQKLEQTTPNTSTLQNDHQNEISHLWYFQSWFKTGNILCTLKGQGLIWFLHAVLELYVTVS